MVKVNYIKLYKSNYIHTQERDEKQRKTERQKQNYRKHRDGERMNEIEKNQCKN